MWVDCFDLKNTLESGQFFRYKLIDGWYYVNAGSKFFRVRQEGRELEFEGVSKDFVRDFFSLDEDYRKILSEITKDDHIRRAVREYEGIRMIKQEPFECLISYICSAAANIPKITMNVDLLAEYFGERVELNGVESYTFPSMGGVNDLDKIKKAKTGFRAKYVLSANNVSRKWLEKIGGMDYASAKKELMKLSGVGCKVADCVLLFGFGKMEAFPVDVWVRRVMKELYNTDDMEFGRKYFGRYAGVAQQYLFHARRSKKSHLAELRGTTKM